MLRPTIVYKGRKILQGKELRRVIKELLPKIINDWHSKILPQKFEESAFNRYKLKQRSKRYSERKFKKYGHKKPLVFSGQLKAEILRRIQISSTSKTATGKLRGPKYMYAYHKGIQIDKAEEIVKTTLKETEQMASMMNTLLQEYINNDKGKETIKVR